MNMRTDHEFTEDKLSAISRRLVDIKERVLAEWEKRIRASSRSANRLRHPILIDTLPAYYDNLVIALSPGYLPVTPVSSAVIASEHGGERARMTSYSPEELVFEYQIFRATLFDLLSESGIAPSTKEISIVHASIDDSIKEAVTSFSLVVTALREHFIAALTHDMRGPLGSASVAAEIIRLTANSPETIELANRVRDNIKRVETMVEGLLDAMTFQRGEKLRLELTHFDIHALADEIRGEYLHIHKMRCDIRGKSVLGWWGREALKRALENLIGNALKYGDYGAPIRIGIDEGHGRLKITVQNEGPPIPIENRESIFQIFRRAQDAQEGKQKGWGIGLPYVRAVAESHGGSVAVDCSTESGTTFVIDIPVDCRSFQDAQTI